MASGWREWLAARLPWYDSARERQRDARADRTIRRTEVARLRGERVIAEYREAEKASGKAGDAMVEEVRRDDK